MIRYALIAVIAFALGVLVRDVTQDWRDAKAKHVVFAEHPGLSIPIRCDAVIEQRTKPTHAWTHKCYIAGLRK